MNNLLFVHQSSDMYGSDKVLLSLVAKLDRSIFHPIVLLPSEGPLTAALRSAAVETYTVPLFRVNRSIFRLRKVVKIPNAICASNRAINQILAGRNVSLVHSNTLAVLSGALWAKRYGKPHVWHVHEMIVKPLMVRKGFAWLLRMFATKIVCNSNATAKLILQDQPKMKDITHVVWNGLDRESTIHKEQVENYRKELGIDRSEVLIALVGRINKWKGQCLLVKAAEILESEGVPNVRYVIVGSPPRGHGHFLSTLQNCIESSVAKHRINLQPYTQDVWTIWDACDIAVVPSTKPEPFGMVALEAMAARKPVIAADHGGVAEIVRDGETGILFRPNSAEKLAEALKELILHDEKRNAYGEAGFRRGTQLFSLKEYVNGMTKVYNAILS